jgi:hypothetical protein
MDMSMEPLIPAGINIEKAGFPPIGRIDTAYYPASFLRKAYYPYSLPQVSLASRPYQPVKYSG